MARRPSRSERSSVATFESADEFYGVFGAFLTDLMSDPEIGPKFAEVDKALLMRFSNPDATILLDCTTAPPTVTTAPPSGTEGDVALSMKADDGHKFWLGNYNITLGLAKRSVKVSGNIAAMLGLLPALQPAFARYEAYLKTINREDLLD
jgi:hypothetical protein